MMKEEIQEAIKLLDDSERNDLSDGYHTFKELYEHRILLFLGLILHNPLISSILVKDHYPGWDLILSYLPPDDAQISYHISSKYRELYEGIIKEGQDEWDGHTSKQVATRLFNYLKDKVTKI